MKKISTLFFCATITALLHCLQSAGVVRADPAFRCTEVDDFTSLKTFDQFVKCGRDCDCTMFELMCLERPDDWDEEVIKANFTLHHRSLDYAQSECENNPNCLCNTQDVFADYSYFMLSKAA